MPISKINYGEETLMDLTEDTVTAETLLEGTTAHDSTGAAITGNVKVSEIDQTFNAESTNAQSGTAVAEALKGLNFTYVESLTSDPVILRSLEEGNYVLDGWFKPYSNASSMMSLHGLATVSANNSGNGTKYTIVIVLSPMNSSMQYIYTTDTDFLKREIKIQKIEVATNKVTSISDESTDDQYPSAAATKTYVDNNKTSIVMKTWTSSDVS